MKRKTREECRSRHGGSNCGDTCWKQLDPYSTEGLEARFKKRFKGGSDYKFKGFVGQGAYGVTALIHDTKQCPPRPLIIKRALAADVVDDLETEIQALKLFRGAAHIVQMIDYRDCKACEKVSDRKLPGPYIVLDYLENGTFEDFMERVGEAKVRVPNRVLWFIMLCFIRALAGLAWPAKGEQGAESQLEESSSEDPTGYAHNDLHTGNIMFGGLDPEVEEHSLVPLCKIIDFGSATSRELFADPDATPNLLQGQASNMEGLARIMMRLITGEAKRLPDRPAKMPSGIETDATLLFVPAAKFRYKWLDENLRDLIGNMMARDHQYRPALDSTLQGTLERATNLRSKDFPEEIREEERTSAIQAFVQRFFLDARGGN
ncbi:hypothetical protein PG996_008001 [Apiospora saccharicola]|uniref:Protein kinase domain-containing protein n=1 Tax=Apiospora saccharicola TaxID=335842 RepID=A0ABR1UZT4_9PEZI